MSQGLEVERQGSYRDDGKQEKVRVKKLETPYRDYVDHWTLITLDSLKLENVLL